MFPFIVYLLIANISVSFGQRLIPYYQAGNYGYCNFNKEIIIKPQYDGCGFFNEGLAWFKKGDKYGYLNLNGQIIVNPDFSVVSNFKYGTAIVYKGEDFYVVNTKGRKLNKKGYVHAIRVADSLIACDDGNTWQIINNKGKSIYEFEEEIIDFNWDNMDFIKVNDTASNITYLNLHTGLKQIEKPKSKFSFLNSDSLKLVTVTEGNNIFQATNVRIIDKNNKVVIPEKYGSIISGNNFEFIFCMDDDNNNSQIYISSKKKFSDIIPYLIQDIKFEQNGEAFAFQKIEDKYYFLCQLKTKTTTEEVQYYICIDEDGKIYADF